MTGKEQTGLDSKALAKRFRDALDRAAQEDPVQHIREAFQQQLGEPVEGYPVRQKIQESGGAAGDGPQQRGGNREPWWKRVFRW